ncbi:MAG: cob(I)yrinic acid a,c-diamide adenosyltransferase [Candidatus Gastranaerophilaceae bacterium]
MTDSENNNLINPDWAKHGYIQVYTGNGKGKTTASLGLAMRALGRKWKVLLVMFLKGGNDYGELTSFQNLSPEIKNNLTIVQAGLDRIAYSSNINNDDKKAVQTGWELVKKSIINNEYNLIILDEANIAIALDLIDINEVIDILKSKPEEMEIVITGRNADPRIIELAHLVSEIKPVKHYWNTGIVARKGIEY